MREVCFLLVQDKILRAYFGSATSIPDEREHWEAIWAHRNEITEIAHSHPGGFLDFSHEDLTTMEAVEAGTGKTFTWSIVTKMGFRSRKEGKDHLRADSPWWLSLIRRLSYGSLRPPAAPARPRGESDGRGIKSEGIKSEGQSQKTIRKRKDQSHERIDQHYLSGPERKLSGQHGPGRGRRHH
jgi:hypothetical protein